MGSDGTRPIEPDEGGTETAPAADGGPPHPADTAPGPEAAEATRIDLVELSDDALETRVDPVDPAEPQAGPAPTRIDLPTLPDETVNAPADAPEASDDVAEAPGAPDEVAEIPADEAETPDAGEEIIGEAVETDHPTAEDPADMAETPGDVEEIPGGFAETPGDATGAPAEGVSASGDVPVDADPAGTLTDAGWETLADAEIVEPVEQSADPADLPAGADHLAEAGLEPGGSEPGAAESEPGSAEADPVPAETPGDGGTAEAARGMTPSDEVEAEPVGVAAASGAAAAGAAQAPAGGSGTAVLTAAGPGGVAVLEKEDPAVGAAVEKGSTGAEPGGRKHAKRRERKQRSRMVRYTRRIVFGVLGFLLLAVAAFAVAYMLTPVPSPQEDATAQGPEFYYDDGKTLIAKIGVNRQKVDLEEVPDHVRDAVIAAENRSFYEDPGVSVRGTIRAFWSTVSGEQLQGGSTITQQMVRNYYQGLGQERTVSRKLKEIMVSLKVGSQKDKDWILEQYLNTIYFGRDAYGIQAAAQAYYGKDVKDLTSAEAAYLAAAIQQPTPFGDPTGDHRAMAEQRWRSVVTAMTETGALSAADAAAMTFPEPDKLKVTDILKGQTGYMVRIAQKELRERRGYTEDQINRSGLKITTTFDKKLMDAAQKAVKDNLPDNVGKRTLTGLVSVDPDTGQVVAFYGGRGYLEEQLSTSFGHWAQAGSGFKPIVLAAALDDGKTLGSVVNGSSPQYYNGTPVRNSGGTSYGMINLVTATQNSVNTAYVNLGREIGLDKVTEMAEKMGIPSEQLTANGANTAPTFPLGVVSVHPVQQAGVYATFAAEGVHRTPYVVKSVTELDGDEHEYTQKGQRVFSEQVARDATYAMTKVVQSGTGTGAQLYDGRDVAGKTGTTDNGNALWFNGFIPQLATSVAIFRSDSPTKQVQIGGYSAFGGVLPAQIWRAYMTEAVNIKNLPPRSFGAPSSYTYGGGGYGRTTQRPEDPSTEPPSEPSAPPTRPEPEPSDPGSGGPQDPQDPQDPPAPSDPPSGGGGGGGEQGAIPQQSKVYGALNRRE